MYRFYDWMTKLRPDFWTTFYEHPELLDLFSYAHSSSAADSGYKMLEAYDIVDIGEHNPGKTVTWVPIQLTGYQHVVGSDYPHTYQIDPAWIYIDCIHDRQVNPSVTLQHRVDYKYEKGTLSFIKFPVQENLIVSKGLYAGTRLADDFGTAFGHQRTDSFAYRDNIVPLMAMFYLGPSIFNLKAACNVMINNPVAKYQDEKIVSTSGGDVITDAYRYNLGSAKLAIDVGSKMRRHQPFADAIEMYTDKTHPNWWSDRIPGLFKRYRVDGPVGIPERDSMMSTFLKWFVAQIRINLNKTDWRKYQYDADVWDLILDAAPIRSDFILSMYWHQVDLQLPLPDFSRQKIRSHVFSIWGMKDLGPNVESWLYAPREADRTIYPDGTTDVDWFVDSYRYHILDDDKFFQEFWSSENKQCSYVEPHVSNWYCRNTSDPKIPMVSKKVKNIELPNVQDVRTKIVTRKPLESQVIDHIEEDATFSQFSIVDVMGEQNIAHEDLDDWQCFGTTHLGIEGLLVGLSRTDYAISNSVSVGGIPKTIRVRVNKKLAKGTSIALQYSVDNKTTWNDLPADHIIPKTIGQVYFKVTIQSSAITSPVFLGLDLSIRV